MYGWEFYQKVDYEQLPLKCRKCHEYRHFIKNCPKSPQEEGETNSEEGWHQAKRGKNTNLTTNNNSGKGQEKTQEQPTKSKGPLINNPFDALQVEEGEIPNLENNNKEDRIESVRT